MKRSTHKLMHFALLSLTLLFFVATAFSQSAGDYRSRVALGTWSNASTWEVYDGEGWSNASQAPSSADGIITIRSTDSVILGSSITIDQVVVDGRLAIFSSAGTITVTLNSSGSAPDLIVNGTLTLALNCVLTGAGTIETFGESSILAIRNSARLNIPSATIDHLAIFGNTVNIESTTLINNGELNWQSGAFNLTTASIINNGIFYYSGAVTTVNITSSGSSTFLNSPGASLFRSTPGVFTINPTIAFTNQGTIRGAGQFIATTTSNTGVLAPGFTGVAGQLNISPSVLASKAATVEINILTPGAVAGTNYDQLQLSATTIISASSLVVTDNAADPVGTVYTILTGPYQGAFFNVTLPPSLGNLVYGTSVITVTKTGTVPLIWGQFTVASHETNDAKLDWSTLQESNVADFEIEYATEAGGFVTIGTVAANGNTNYTSRYSFIHKNLPAAKYHRYRIRQKDFDGKFTYSAERILRVAGSGETGISVYPNPFVNQVQITTGLKKADLRIIAANGRVMQQHRIQAGTRTFDLSQLSRGSYIIQVILDREVVANKIIVKQ